MKTLKRKRKQLKDFLFLLKVSIRRVNSRMRRNKNILLFLFLSIFIVFNTACTKENIDSNNSETNCKIVFTFIGDEFTSIGGNNFGENYVIENQGVLTEFPKIESAKLNRKFLGFYTNSSFSGEEVGSRSERSQQSERRGCSHQRR